MLPIFNVESIGCQPRIKVRTTNATNIANLQTATSLLLLSRLRTNAIVDVEQRMGNLRFLQQWPFGVEPYFLLFVFLFVRCLPGTSSYVVNQCGNQEQEKSSLTNFLSRGRIAATSKLAGAWGVDKGASVACQSWKKNSLSCEMPKTIFKVTIRCSLLDEPISLRRVWLMSIQSLRLYFKISVKALSGKSSDFQTA